MTQAYNCLPTDLWIFDPTTPKGFYFNRGVYYFGRMVENDMNAAEQSSRKNRKPGVATDALANGARLGVLEKHLGIPMKRFRDPGNVSATESGGKITDQPGKQKDESIIIKID